MLSVSKHSNRQNGTQADRQMTCQTGLESARRSRSIASANVTIYKVTVEPFLHNFPLPCVYKEEDTIASRKVSMLLYRAPF